MKARVLTDHPTPFLLTSFAVAGLGAGVVYRFGPRLMRLPRNTAAIPGFAAAAVAYLVMQVQGPVAGYFFADPLDRFERQFTQQRAHLSDRPGAGGTVDTEQQPQNRVRQIVS